MSGESANHGAANPLPAYADDAARTRGERLLERYRAMQAAPGDAEVASALMEARRAMRQGPVLHPGEIVADRYRLLTRLRDGAVAATWRGWDLVEDEAVEVKVLHARFIGDADAEARFFGSAAQVEALAHPNLPRVRVARATWEGFPIFVTDAHGATTLEARVQAGLSRWSAVQAVVDAGRALAAAHARQMFHRDVNPGTIIVDERGAAWLSDFDLAPPAALQMGSAYQAPESMEPDAAPSAGMDVYALGMTLLFALHGAALPFWVIRDPERLIRAIDAPEAVRDAVRRAASWDPEQRPASVESLLDEVLAPIEVLQALADAALDAGRVDLAADHFWQLVARCDGHPDLRVGLARALAALGDLQEASNQLMLALQDDRLAAIDDTLAELRGLSERSGAWAPLVEVLERRAAAPSSPRDVLLLEVARLHAAHGTDPAEQVAAWHRALDAHVTRAQAREASRGLLALHSARDAWDAWVQVARDLLPLLDLAQRAELQHELGRVHLDRLGDQQGGLAWLERARDSGFEHPDLAPTLERIRAERGDWPQVIALMEEQAQAQEGPDAVRTLRRAARIAWVANHDAARAEALLESLVARAAEDAPDRVEAATWLAGQARARGDGARALRLLESLPAAPPVAAAARADWLVHNAQLAELLLGADRVDEARARLRAGLEAQPAHLATLHQLAQLRMDLGELTDAEQTWAEVFAIVGGTGHPLEREARAALVDLAWVQGDLEGAMEHAHALQRARPQDADTWWALSKVAIWASCASNDDAPWLRATPLCFTREEALTRLLCGVVTRAGLDDWMRRDPLGASLAELLTGRTTLEVAAVAVDLMRRRGLVGPGLFDRLGEAFPEAGVSVEAVRWLWCEESSDAIFPVAESYRWSDPDRADPALGSGVPRGFDPRIHRTVLPGASPITADVGPPRPSLAALTDPSAFERLLHRDEAPLPIEAGASTISSAAPQLASERPRRLVLQWEDAPPEVVDDGAVVLAEGVELQRCGARVYVVGAVSVDGRDTVEARLVGGERVACGGRAFRVLLLDPHEALPEPQGLPADGLDELVIDLGTEPENGADADRPSGGESDLPGDDRPAEPAPSRRKARTRPLEIDDLDLGEFMAAEDDPTIDVRRSAPGQPRAVVVERFEGEERRVPFDDDVFVIGRSPTDDIFLDVPGVGFLFRLYQTLDGFSIEEMFLDGSVEERRIDDGESFSAAGRSWTFRLGDGAHASDPAPTPARPSPTVALTPFLVQEDGSTLGRVIPVRRDSFTIGRGRKNDLQLHADAKISRHHCTIVRTGDGVVKLRDNNSSNGTFVNGRKVHEHVLEPGDAIAVGDHLFEFRLGHVEDDAEPAPLAALPADLSEDPVSGHATQILRVDDLREILENLEESPRPKRGKAPNQQVS